MTDLPALFRERMRAQLGDAADAFFESYGRPLPHALRVNTRKTSPEALAGLLGCALSPVPWNDAGFYYPEEARPGKRPYHDAGLYYIQEPSAMSAAPALAACPGERVLDLCAAPGGKTASIAAMMEDTGLLAANEIDPGRARILSQNVERLGFAHTVVTSEPPDALAARFPLFFDRILTDAPCSGEGMFRKEPEALTHWSPENIARCAARQRDILRAAAAMLRPGGRLVYSTCTFAPEENEGQIDAFLREHREFRLLELHRLLPHEVEGEGHFVAVLEKEGSPEPLSGKKTGPARKKAKKHGAPRLSREAASLWAAFREEVLTPPAANLPPEALLSRLFSETPLAFGDMLYLPPAVPDLAGLRVLRPGLQLGSAAGGRFTPSHALALALAAGDAKRRTDLSEEAAARYIAGETVPSDAPSGWGLVTVSGFPLAWGKVSGGVCKNHYPKGLRHF